MPQPRHQSAALPQLRHRLHALLRQSLARRPRSATAAQMEGVASRGHHENTRVTARKVTTPVYTYNTASATT